MSYYSKKDAFLYCSGYDLGGYLETIGVKQTDVIDEWRPLGSTAMTRAYTGEKNGELTLAGLYEDESTALVAAMPDSTARVWVAGFETDDETQRFWGFRSAVVGEGEIILEDEKMDRIQPVMVVSGAVNEGYVVAPLAARTTAGNTQATYADMAASTTTGSAFLICTALDLDGYTSLTVTVQSCDTSDGAYADETAFTTLTDIGGECITLVGTVNRYLAVKWAWVGSGTDPSATFWVGVSKD